MAESLPASQGIVVVNKLSAPVVRHFEPVGRWYESRARHRLLSSSSAGGIGRDSEEEGEEEGRGDDVSPFLLDPTQWKDQDHYMVLGLGKLRYRASQQDIRKAYRQKVLVHHPDKQQQAAAEGDGEGEGDDHFKCIKIAYDILSNKKRRQAFDSVDPTFDDTVPPNNSHSRDNFFEVFGLVFSENERWSSTQPVPQLGDPDATYEQVNAFYSFWYDFDSWREFSYMDEENLEKAESREERRWMDKQNKTVRQKRKKEEMARLRTLVDTAYTLDPRIKKFKEMEKAEKEARKKARAEAAKQEALERERMEQLRLAEEKQQKEREEERARAQAALVKKEKDAAKKVLRRERKAFRAMCKAHNYYGGAAEGELMAGRMQELEGLCECLTVEQLQALNEQMSGGSMEEGQAAVEAALCAMKQREEAELAAQARVNQGGALGTKIGVKDGTDKEWTRDQVQLLVKAVSLYPAGTNKRWEVIASFINNHSPEGSKSKTAKQVINKVKSLQRVESSQKEAENSQAFQHYQQTHSSRPSVSAPPTQRYGTAAS